MWEDDKTNTVSQISVNLKIFGFVPEYFVRFLFLYALISVRLCMNGRLKVKK